jgi:hypothetical protein
MSVSKRGIEAGRAVYRLMADDAEFRKGLRASVERFRDFGKKIAGIGAGIGGLGSVISAPFIGAAMQFAATGDQLDKMSIRTGVAVEELSTLGICC